VKPYVVLILAAGLSRRMGQFKPLLSIGGETITDHLISTFLACGVDVYVVVGYRAGELKAAIEHRGVTVIENPDYVHGMFTSVQAGAHALAPGYRAFFVMPVDMPLVRPSTILRLLVASSEHPGNIIYPVYGGKRGHPPLIPVSLAPVITGWKQEGNLREVLNLYERLALQVSVRDANIHVDIDTADDYRLLAKRFQRTKP